MSKLLATAEDNVLETLESTIQHAHGVLLHSILKANFDPSILEKEITLVLATNNIKLLDIGIIAHVERFVTFSMDHIAISDFKGNTSNTKETLIKLVRHYDSFVATCNEHRTNPMINILLLKDTRHLEDALNCFGYSLLSSYDFSK